MSVRLAIVASHPVQYYAPLYREIANRLDLHVIYCHRATEEDQAQAGFKVGFTWDVDLTSGYDHTFLPNASRYPNLGGFWGVSSPSIGHHLRKGGFDAVLIMGWHLMAFHQALWAAKRAGLPVMVRGDSHLETPRSAWKRVTKNIIYPLFLRIFDAALVVGEKNRQYWRHYGYPDAKIYDSPHCIDSDWFSARATKEARESLRAELGISKEYVVLFVGRLVPLKRVKDLIEAVSLARTRGFDLRVLVAGSGPLEADLRRLASLLDLKTDWLGFCNQSKMPSVYAAADLLVLPSNHETWGLVVNEALACGRPVLVSDNVGCAPDVQAVLGSTCVFPCGDVVTLADHIIAATSDPPSRETLVRATSQFSLKAAADGIEHAVRYALKERSRRGT